MKNISLITTLSIMVAIIAGIATASGIFSRDGSGSYVYHSIRGEDVVIYGKGLYNHMSADVAIQGIAQDYITLFLAVPALLFGLHLVRKHAPRGLLMVTGILAYFLVTYLFYTAMAMYNIMFLAYVTLPSLSFFGFILSMLTLNNTGITDLLGPEKLLQNAGTFLVLNSLMVTFLWLNIILPPLFDGSIYPKALQHYATLTVQGFDLGLLLPIGIVSGVLAIQKHRCGYLFTTVNLIFLSLLMAALTSKIIFMARAGVNVIPVIFIMPTMCFIASLFSAFILRGVKVPKLRDGEGGPRL